MMSEALTRPGTMSTILAGSRSLCLNFQTSEAGAVLPLGMWKSLVDFIPVGM